MSFSWGWGWVVVAPFSHRGVGSHLPFFSKLCPSRFDGLELKPPPPHSGSIFHDARGWVPKREVKPPPRLLPPFFNPSLSSSPPPPEKGAFLRLLVFSPLFEFLGGGGFVYRIFVGAGGAFFCGSIWLGVERWGRWREMEGKEMGREKKRWGGGKKERKKGAWKSKEKGQKPKENAREFGCVQALPALQALTEPFPPSNPSSPPIILCPSPFPLPFFFPFFSLSLNNNNKSISSSQVPTIR